MTIEGGLHDYARPRIRNRSAILVAVAVGIGLLVLVAAAFSVASESRVVANRSAQLHANDEVLRSLITVRSQLGSAINLLQIDEVANTDSSAGIDRSLDDAEVSLGDLRTIIGSLEPGTAGLNGLRSFVATAQEVLDLARTNDTISAREALVNELDPQYADSIDTVVAERDRLATALVKADDALGRLGALATFIIAFFVPTVAMFVYRQITRRQRETVELAELLAESRSGASWRTELVTEAATLTAAEVESLPVSPLTARLKSRLKDLDFLIRASSTGHGYLFESFGIGDLRTEIQATWPGLVSVAGDAAGVVWADRDAVLLLCNDIIRNAEIRGAERVLVAGGSDHTDIWIAITDNGTPLDPEAVSAVLDSASLFDSSARSLDSDASMVLTVGRLIAPALGGSFWCDSVGANTRFTVRLPMAGTTKKRPAAQALNPQTPSSVGG